MDSELITQLLMQHRRRRSYLDGLAQFMGYKDHEAYLKDHPEERTEPPRKPYRPKIDRLEKIALERYNLPQELFDAIVEEVRDDYSDW